MDIYKQNTAWYVQVRATKEYFGSLHQSVSTLKTNKINKYKIMGSQHSMLLSIRSKIERGHIFNQQPLPNKEFFLGGGVISLICEHPQNQ